MAQAFDAAWGRALASTEASGRQRRAHAEQAVAGNWLAGAPALELSQREGRGAAAAGRETELGVALPLWRLGQRQLSGQAAQAELDAAQAGALAARWRLAAQVREQAARWRVAEAEAAQAAHQWQLSEALAADVERRVRAGDQAPVDVLAAKAEALAARAQAREVQQAEASQRAAWLLLTGTAAQPQPEARSGPSEPALHLHPEALLADALVQQARQRVALVQSQRAAAPELGIGWRQERPGAGQATQNSIGVALRLPLGSTPHSQPQMAAALAELDLALASQTRTHQQLAAELGLAQSGLASVAEQHQAEAERAALLRERALLLNKAYTGACRDKARFLS